MAQPWQYCDFNAHRTFQQSAMQQYTKHLIAQSRIRKQSHTSSTNANDSMTDFVSQESSEIYVPWSREDFGKGRYLLSVGEAITV